ncbi:RCC1/BLIP-II [Lophium mytilinum]|uniref:RCC1/BLIP-II n=1 Tax=Lophium mytilinum TaxID=390894 RepID=A0A6A6QBD1_9PEZI|nr:RCC1/BLIP-II [Lophium mytilinum]
MAKKVTPLTDLPLDILVLVFPYLDAKSFLALCATCKAFHQPSISLDSAYWSRATRSAFRVPNQPVVQSDGVRWQKMYRRLLTQSRVFTWGSNTHGCLGHTYQEEAHQSGMLRRRWVNSATNASFPIEVEHSRELGITSDMQCGGWSTTLLTSKGSLYTFGVLDGLTMPREVSSNKHELLKYPPGFPQSTDRYDPAVATLQFSSGRSHVLALADSGRIWSWYAFNKAALHVKFLHIDINEASPSSSSQTPTADTTGQVGRVRQVVAGWGHSSAYVCGTGIVLWSPVKRPRGDQVSDMMLVVDSAVVPKTSYQRPKHASRQSKDDKALGDEVGMVSNYIILEHFVVFVTDLGKVFAAKIGDESTTTDIVELRRLRNDTGTHWDVQGSFRRFASFKNDEVIITDQGYLDRCWEARFDNPAQTNIHGLQRIPALQDTGVISVAFGDHHYHALHRNGRITSYGKDPQGCGALGLGSENNLQAMIRGINIVANRGEGELLRETYTTGRQVWFEEEKRKFMRFMGDGGQDPSEARERMELADVDPTIKGEVSEWFEQETRDWDKRPELKDADEDRLGAYFALSVSAAGWHSGALVLVNDVLAEMVRESCKGGPPERSPHEGKLYEWEWKDWPRLRLADGREMPGEVEFSEWKYGRPDFERNFEA